jgi:protein O-mannosyl-transferase
MTMVTEVNEMSTEAPQANFEQTHGDQRRLRQLLYLGLLVAAVVLVYGNALPNGFAMDDGLYISGNPQVTAATLRGLFRPNQYSKVLRPLTFASFALNWFVGRGQALGFHLVNLLLHAGVTCLVYLLLQKLLPSLPRGQVVAFAGALVFAVHPIHTEAVTSAVGRAELLAAGFLLAAWLLHLEGHELPAMMCFAAALLSKESAVVFLPLVLVGDYTKNKVKSYSRYAWIALVTTAYMIVLWKLQGGRLGTGAVSKMDNPLAGIPVEWRVLNALHVAWKYVALQVFPAALSCDYSFNQIPVFVDIRHALPWVVATVAALCAWFWGIRKRQHGLLLAGAIYVCGFATTSNILMPVGTIMGERLAYFPSIGFCLLVALTWNWLMARRRALAFAVLAIVAAALGIRTVIRNRDWKDNLRLYTAAVRTVPNSAKMHSNLGYAYLEEGKLDLARKELDAALQIYPENPDTLEGYGLLESRAGNYQAAGRMLEAAFYTSTRENPNYDYMAVNLAALYIQTDHLDGAMQLLNREIAEAPEYGRAWANRAVIHYKRGETAAARSDAETALRLEPGNSQAQNLTRLLKATSQPVQQ